MIRFVHTADLHFGVENYGKPEHLSGIHSRLMDFHRALSACIDAAIANQVDFFLFAGDAYKTATPSPTQQRLLFDCFLRLYKAQIPVVIIVGNHDNPSSFGKTHALDLFDQLPVDGFHVVAQPQKFVLQTKNGPVQIVGIPWPSRATLALNRQGHTSSEELNQQIVARLGALIQKWAGELDPAEPAVFAGHLTVSSGLFSGSERRASCGHDPLFLPSQLALKPFDYIALGHLHRHQQVNPGEHPAIVYPGSIERIDFGERKDPKGFCLVTIHDKNHCTYEFIPVPTRPFVQVDLSLHSALHQTEQVLEALSAYRIDEAIVKIVYHVPAGVKDRVDARAIEQACESAHYLVGLLPVHQPIARQLRSSIKIDMDIATAFTTFCTQKQKTPDEVKRLLAIIHELEVTNEELP